MTFRFHGIESKTLRDLQELTTFFAQNPSKIELSSREGLSHSDHGYADLSIEDASRLFYALLCLVAQIAAGIGKQKLVDLFIEVAGLRKDPF